MTEVPDAPADLPPRRSRLLEIALVFTRLGFTAFGGPMAHLAMMENELVHRRKWCDRQRFLDANAAVNFIPGPNSTELAIHMGFLRGGVPGLVIAGVCFITPAVLIILPLAFLYVRYGNLPNVAPALHSVSAAIVAIVAAACVRLIRQALRDRFLIGIAILTAAVLAADALHLPPVYAIFTRLQPEIVLLAIAAGLGVLRAIKPRRIAGLPGFLPMAQVSLPDALTSTFDSRWIDMLWFFFKVGATLFGSGYVLISFLQSGLVDQYHWLTPNQLNDAIAVGQFTPGPLLTTATFAGYLLGASTFGYGDTGGVIGAILATLAIFLPSFLLIAMLAPLLERLRHSVLARGALDAMNAAVVALIGSALIRLAAQSFTSPAGGFDLLNVLIAIAAVALMLWKNVNATWLVAGAIAIGIGRAALGYG